MRIKKRSPEGCFVRECVEISLENLHVDVGTSMAKASF